MIFKYDILKNCFSKPFIKLMENRCLVSHAKYGSLKQTKNDIRVHRDEIINLKHRLSLYEKTGNTEYLVDVANFAMFEYMEMTGCFIPTDDDPNSYIIKS